ncbi:YdcF family protein [Candidatus Woesearchaeota archaeon]|nr:YdcF family protein [Candidatus Woesearchaeota archaeon]
MKPTLILGFTGGSDTRNRASAVLQYCSETYKNSRAVPPMIVSGVCSGMKKTRPEKPEAIEMKDYLVEGGIPAERIVVEQKALDGIASIVYSLQVARDKGISYSRIAFATSYLSVDRVQRYFELIVGERQQNISLPDDDSASPLDKTIERLVTIATIHDLEHLLRKGVVTTGDISSFDENYLQTEHPFHGKRPHLMRSWYGRGIVGLRAVQKLQSLGIALHDHYSD